MRVRLGRGRSREEERAGTGRILPHRCGRRPEGAARAASGAEMVAMGAIGGGGLGEKGE